MEDGTSVRNAMKMRPSRRNEGPMVVVVDEYFKLCSCDDGEEREEQVGNHFVTSEERIKTPVVNDGRVERFGKDERYPKRKQHLQGEW